MSIHIRFATDFVCPYCIAAKETLMAAIAGREDVTLEILPFELTQPPKERVDTYHDEVRRAKWAKDLVPFCQQIGLDAHFPPKVIPRPYTTLAFEGFHYAKAHGKELDYCDRMYHAYFVEERDIGDLDVLVSIARELGLDGDDFCQALEQGTYREIQRQAVEETRQLGVTAVPTIWVNEMRLTGDLLTKEDFSFYLELAASGGAGSFGSGGCGADGC
jgi:predicted DsbA family dithiol-disulfide isomerase